VKYLLDVNALVALGVKQHEFHARTANWVWGLAPSKDLELLTCSITELGFVRIVAQVARYGLTLGQAQSLLIRVKAEGLARFAFISDDQDISQLPAWVSTPGQVTDGHLVSLAKAHNSLLATLDAKIPRALLIPPVM
jgi:predicted nucleic acid-binding protein